MGQKKVFLPPLLLLSFLLTSAPLHADQVITKDGKVYTGKILIDSDKAVLIGNPPFDPNSTLIQSDDIKEIIYEQYHPNAPAERRRGLAFDGNLVGNVFSSSDLSLNPAMGLMFGAGFRLHPFFELDGGVQWDPAVSASGSGLAISNSTTTRGYQSFYMHTETVAGRFYPFFQKKQWKTEPYLMGGYGWSHLIPKDSGDSLRGSGWLLGVGAIRPLTRNLFLDGRFTFQSLSFGSVTFLGQDGDISPKIVEHLYSFIIGLSYRI
jgi:hypothetical protein